MGFYRGKNLTDSPSRSKPGKSGKGTAVGVKGCWGGTNPMNLIGPLATREAQNDS